MSQRIAICNTVPAQVPKTLLSRTDGTASQASHIGSLSIAVICLTMLACVGSAAAARRVPAFPKLKPQPLSLLIVTNRLQPGDHGEIAFQVATHASCSLFLYGPGRIRSGPYIASTRVPYGVWRWRVPTDARGGVWTATVSCRTRHLRTTRTARLLVGVTPRNLGSIVERGSLTAAVSRTPPIVFGGAGVGKGGGGYPDDGALCKWTGRHSGPCSDYDWGYRSASGQWSLLSARGFYYRNCTDFVAWFTGLTWSSFHFPANKGNAADWKAYAGNAGLQVTMSPSVGDIAWWGGERAHGFGHVAIVAAVNPNHTVTIAEYNGDGQGNYDLRPSVSADAYLHRPPSATPPPATSQYAGHIVQWNGDKNPQKTAWLVGPDGKRYWIPTIAIYWCLKEQGHAGPDVLSATTLERLPDSGQSATCSGGKGGGGSSSEPLPHTEPPPPPIPPPTYTETVGGVTHTWTNYTNAGGTQGPSIPSNTTVQIACKVTGFAVADGNTWWYRVASAPWSDTYYASADAFYNNGQTSGSLHGTPFVDPAVPNC